MPADLKRMIEEAAAHPAYTQDEKQMLTSSRMSPTPAMRAPVIGS